jgi:hypothetical protein
MEQSLVAAEEAEEVEEAVLLEAMEEVEEHLAVLVEEVVAAVEEEQLPFNKAKALLKSRCWRRVNRDSPKTL